MGEDKHCSELESDGVSGRISGEPEDTVVRKMEMIIRDLLLTVQYFKVIEVQPDIVNPEHGVVLTHPSLKVHVHLDQAGVLRVRDVAAADKALKLSELKPAELT